MVSLGMHGWWQALHVQHKVWSVLVLLLIPLGLALGVHLYLVNLLLQAQQDRHQTLQVREQLQVVRRIAIDIEDAFRGYVLTEQDKFLIPMRESEARLETAVSDIEALRDTKIQSAGDLQAFIPRVKDLLRSKQALIDAIKSGKQAVTLSYIHSGQGLLLSDALRRDLRIIEDRLDDELRQLEAEGQGLSQWTFTGLWFAVAAVTVLGAISSRLLVRSITEPIKRLQSATAQFGPQIDPDSFQKLVSPSSSPGDELSMLALSYHEMAVRISGHIRELETLEAIGREINTIGPDGVAGVLRRITDRAVELVQADACLLLSRNDTMGCWIVEAASGAWDGELPGAVMLWEELPVSVRAYHTGEPAFGEHFRRDDRPEVRRRNLIGDSMLAVPLLAQGVPFGVIAMLTEQPRPPEAWNIRLAQGLAQAAAVAISNARLYETAHRKQQGLQARMRQLEQLAENLAHDLKGPGARMGELSRLFVQQYRAQTDERAARWLRLIEENAEDIVRRVEGILSVARIGADQSSVTAVDPVLVIDEVLKAHAGDLERLSAAVRVQPGLPMVACHGTYLRQVFDNLIGNALKYMHSGYAPSVAITYEVQGNQICFAVTDNGIGIAPDQRQRVFDPFVRLRRTEAPGSGIGLTIVRRIVELYGGQVWIDGAEPEGCTVKFTMPRFHEESALTRGTASENRPHEADT